LNEFDDDIGLPEPDTRSSNKKEEGKGSFGNTEQGWDEIKTNDSFSIGSDISNQRDRIVVLGRTRSGKTVFLTRLYHACWEGKSGLRMACQSGPDHLNLMTQYAEMEKGVWPAATQGSRHYTIDVTKDDYTIPMVILDYPGEVFQNAFIHEIDDENTQELLGHIDRAIAVLIIVDPGGAMHDDSTIEKVHDDYGISKAISRVRQSPGGEDIPIAIVLTKCDIHAKKILTVMDKKGMTGKSKWTKFLIEYYNSWFYSLGSRRKYRVFPVAAVRTRKDARGNRIPDLSKPHYNLLEPIIWPFDIVRKYREKDQEAQEMREKAEKFAHFQKVEAQKSKKEKISLLLFWIFITLLLGVITWGTFELVGSKNGSIERDENKSNQSSVILKDTFNTET